MYETHPQWVPDGIIASRDVFNNINVIKDEARKLFNSFDRDLDGLLNIKEFKLALQSLGIRKKQSKMIRQLYDIENTRLINTETFIQIYCFVRSGRLYT